MRKWANTGAQSLALRWPVKHRLARCRPPWATGGRVPLRRSFTTHGSSSDSPGNPQTANSNAYIFERVKLPENGIEEWVALLDQALPSRLRSKAEPLADLELSAQDLADILLAAQHPRKNTDQSIDLLYHLGCEQGRWTAVVLIVKKLVEAFPSPHAPAHKTPPASDLWSKQRRSLRDLTAYKTTPSSVKRPRDVTSVKLPSLDEITGDASASPDHANRIAHKALGQIWRSIGAMTQSCAGGEIKPEILEIIAYLHHNEIMPLSIYNYQGHPDKSAIQQPPLLTLLSSRILTSLSDAAWRAHEKLLVEEAKEKRGEYQALRPEIPGSVYRVSVAGLRPEVWMELILWSCLHGGWLSQGAAVLKSICQDKAWKPLSWREWQKKLLPHGADETSDLTGLDFVFNARNPATRAPAHTDGLDVDVGRTVSAEVVNAYIDALTNTVAVGVGDRGTVLRDLIDYLHQLKNFLRSSGLSLSSGSWDAIITRLVDIQSFDPEVDARAAIELVKLSPTFGQELSAGNTQELPRYVIDGSAATLTLLHRALKGQIAAGSFEGALSVFKEIQSRADADKRRSIVDFMVGSRALFESDAPQGMFTSNFVGIDYPSFNLPIPPATLAAFLDLTTDEKAHDFGRWLLHSRDVDGPVIGADLYDHPDVQPAILRFAVLANDTTLLTSFKTHSLNHDTLTEMINTQVIARRWAAVRRVLKKMMHSPTFICNASTLVHLSHVMITLSAREESYSDLQQDLDETQQLFADIMRGRFDRGVLSTADQDARNTILAVVPLTNPAFTAICLSCSRLELRQRHNFHLSTSSFNLLLDGVVTTRGSAAGRQLLYTLWPPSARHAFDARALFGRQRFRRERMPHYRPHVLDSIVRQNIYLPVPGHPTMTITMHGALVPNVASIFIILRKALAELRLMNEEQPTSTPSPPSDIPSSYPPPLDPAQKASDSELSATQSISPDGSRHGPASPQRMALWAIARLAELPSVPDTVVEELDSELAQLGLDDVRAELDSLVELQLKAMQPDEAPKTRSNDAAMHRS